MRDNDKNNDDGLRAALRAEYANLRATVLANAAILIFKVKDRASAMQFTASSMHIVETVAAKAAPVSTAASTTSSTLTTSPAPSALSVPWPEGLPDGTYEIQVAFRRKTS